MDHPEYRFTGAQLPENGSPIDIQLRRHDQPPSDRSVRLLTRSGIDQQVQLKNLLAPLLKETDKRTSDGWLVPAACYLAIADQEASLGTLATISSERGKVQVLLANGEVDEALEVARGADDPHLASLLVSTATSGQLEKNQVQKLLTEAGARLQNTAEPNQRLIDAARMAIALRRTGDIEGATRLVEQFKTLALESQANDFETGRFAVALAPLDPKGSVRLLSRIERDFTRGAALGDVVAAAAFGGHDCVEAILASSPDPSNEAGLLTRAVYELARLDLPGTLAMIQSAQDRYGGLNSGRSYGYIAMSIHKTDPEQAKLLLRKAFATLGTESMRYHAEHVFTLLRLAEAIDPKSTGEYWWHAVAAHGGPVHNNPNVSPKIGRLERRASLALLLALYKRFPDLQQSLIEPIFGYWESIDTPQGVAFRDSLPAIAAMTVYDPQRTTKLMNHWWENSQGDRYYRTSPDAPWHLVAKILWSDGKQLGRVISKRVHHKWLLGHDYQHQD